MSEKDFEALQAPRESRRAKRGQRGKRSSCPLEYDEQVRLAQYLDARGLLWCHVPNERWSLGDPRGAQLQRARLKAQGVKTGVPDVLIFGMTTSGRSGLAIELKRQRGGKASDAQLIWIEALRAKGFEARVCHGADEAIELVGRMYP